MEYVIGIILMIVVLIIIGMITKKKYFQEIDRLEAWKIEVMNRPVLDEVAKIKQLKMVGQAEEYFERWRKTWDTIVTVDLPDVEEWLYDAEDYVDKYRFSKAKEVFLKIETTLKKAEEKMETMISELNNLIGSEEKNREDIAELQELYKKLKKDLLAHRHTYGKASVKLEQMLEEAAKNFLLFEEETNNGNYLNARDIVLKLKEELTILNEKMKQIPLLLEDCLHYIPSQIKEIVDGAKEMRQQGYYLDHIGLENQINEIEKQIAIYLDYIEKTEIEEVIKGVEEIKENLELLYELLEMEVSSKQFVQSNKPQVKSDLEKIETAHEKLQDEIHTVQLSYQLSDEDAQIVSEMEKKIEQLKKSLHLLLSTKEMEQTAFSVVREKLEEIHQEIKQIEEKQKELSEMLQSLRKDELEAREKIMQLKKQVWEIKRIVSRSNIPGVPSDIEALLLDSFEAVQDCFRYLEQKPLSMKAVQQSLNKADERVTLLHTKVEEMLENVFLIEKIIQYGNRYRKQYPAVHEKLLSAEKAFRSYDYHAALEEAAAAVEYVEPGALKKIESILNEQSIK